MKRLIALFPIFIVVVLCANSYAELPHQFLFGHTGRVLAVAFSLDGRWLASGGANEILIWDAGANEPIYTLTGHKGKIKDLAFRLNGDLASASVDGTVRLWDVPEEREIRVFEGHVGQVTSVDFSPDGRRIVSGARDRTLKLWEADAGELLATFEEHIDVVWSVAFSPDGSMVASGSEDGTVRLWDASDSSHLHSLVGHTQGVLSVAFHPDGNVITSGARDGTVRLWNIHPAEPADAIGETEPFATYDRQVLSVRFNPDGRTLAVGLLNSPTDNTLKLWDVPTHSELRSFDTQIAQDLSFSPTRPQLAVVGAAAGTITVWDSSHPKPALLEPQGGLLVEAPQVTLRWEAVESSVYYDVEISSDSDFTASNTRFAVTVNSTSFEAENNVPSYWWRVRTGSFGGVSEWSEVGTFRVPSCVVRIVPPIRRVNLGEEFTVDVSIESVIDLRGFQFDLRWTDPDVLTFVTVTKFRNIFGESGFGQQPTEPPDQKNGIYKNVIAAKTGAGGVSGNGILFGASFRAKALGSSEIQLQNLILVDSNQEQIHCDIHGFKVIVENLVRPWDANRDGVVNIFDLSIVARYFEQPIPTDLEIYPDINGDGVVNLSDFVLVGSHFGESYQIDETSAAAPESASEFLRSISPTTRKQLEAIYSELLSMSEDSLAFNRTRQVLRRLLFPSIPAHNLLLPNYPNPFNPETWIPFHLASAGQVTIKIYDTAGILVRQLDLGYLAPGRYLSRADAAYWDGTNVYGEPVASGIYFYALSTASFHATQKMVILK